MPYLIFVVTKEVICILLLYNVILKKKYQVGVSWFSLHTWCSLCCFLLWWLYVHKYSAKLPEMNNNVIITWGMMFPTVCINIHYRQNELDHLKFGTNNKLWWSMKDLIHIRDQVTQLSKGKVKWLLSNFWVCSRSEILIRKNV